MRAFEKLKRAEKLILEALIGAPLAWQTPDQLADLAGLGIDRTLDALAGLDEAGWVEAFEAWPAGAAATFTARGAAALGLRIIEVGMNEVPRWARPGAPEPPAPAAFGVFANYRGPAGLECALEGRELPPDEALDLQERIELGLSLGLDRERRRESRPDRSKADRRAALARAARKRSKLERFKKPPILTETESI